MLVRYVERNAKRAALVAKAEDWPGSSAHGRLYGSDEQKRLLSGEGPSGPDMYMNVAPPSPH